MTQLVEIDSGDPDIGQVNRPLYSTDDRTIHVEPDGEGTLQALQKQLPLFLFHDWIVQVPNGDYLGEGPAIHLGPVMVKGHAELKIAGNVNNREQVFVDAGINLSAYGKVEKIRVRGLDLHGLTQVDGMAWFTETNLRGNETCGLDGKGGWVQTHDCHIGGPQAEHAVYPNALQRLALRTSQLEADDTAIAGPIGSEVSLDRCQLVGDSPRLSNHHRRAIDGVYRGGRRVAFDD